MKAERESRRGRHEFRAKSCIPPAETRPSVHRGCRATLAPPRHPAAPAPCCARPPCWPAAAPLPQVQVTGTDAPRTGLASLSSPPPRLTVAAERTQRQDLASLSHTHSTSKGRGLSKSSGAGSFDIHSLRLSLGFSGGTRAPHVRPESVVRGSWFVLVFHGPWSYLVVPCPCLWVHGPVSRAPRSVARAP